ncbi:type 4a pilus biogenesis protein PilO [Leucothrix arctica]|uniref:type 4a pilus biogenesis protein PilO n=1 Tax=Leucothrix arctica TaxID=1481894 RepID=UPI001FEC0D22|nr:type 4a pilus biogenesis protein PilO [Leucothrix arctica]
MAIDLQEFNSLVDDPANVSLPVKILAILIICGLVLFMGYKMIVIDKMGELDNVVSKESSLKITYERKQARANQLPAFRAQLKEMQQSFGSLMKQLPSGTEIPGLILDISEKGLSNGLEIELFKPKGENQKEFYAEKPIELKAKGTYNQLAAFVSDISGLPRIVTISNIRLAPEDDKKIEKKKQQPFRLTMQAVIKTYRYLDENEEGN